MGFFFIGKTSPWSKHPSQESIWKILEHPKYIWIIRLGFAIGLGAVSYRVAELFL
jgi:hypothetical protein